MVLTIEENTGKKTAKESESTKEPEILDESQKQPEMQSQKEQINGDNIDPQVEPIEDSHAISEEQPQDNIKEKSGIEKKIVKKELEKKSQKEVEEMVNNNKIVYEKSETTKEQENDVLDETEVQPQEKPKEDVIIEAEEKDKNNKEKEEEKDAEKEKEEEKEESSLIRGSRFSWSPC